MTSVFLLLLLLSISSPVAHARYQEQTHDHAAATSSPKSRAVCLGHRVSIPFSSGTWLPLNHRHGPCSPLPSSERVPSSPAAAQALRRGELRTDAIGRGTQGGTTQHDDVTIPTSFKNTSLHTLQYVVTVGLGTPAINQTVYIDTGSDLSWVQCRPCPVPPCHAQKGAMFDPSRSATYSPFSCDSAACHGLDDFIGCNGSLCQYGILYGDNSSDNGTYSADKLTLTPGYAIDGFRFGCTHVENDSVAQSTDDLTDGLLGLSASNVSLVSQMGAKAFSYCLPPTEGHSGFLRLGVPHVSASRFVVTPMILYENDSKFYVRLEGIAVNGRRLPVLLEAFGDVDYMLDSGTIYTHLPPAAYRALRDAFTKEMRMYPRAPPTQGFDTCFDLGDGGGDVKLPSVALVFDRNVTVELDPSGIILDGCLAFMPTTDQIHPIIGNVQQRTFEVLYDVGGFAVGFRSGAC
ncbi:hypothetical protein ACP4OV_017129 [Aristida adscensionis]